MFPSWKTKRKCPDSHAESYQLQSGLAAHPLTARELPSDFEEIYSSDTLQPLLT
jgi:hypothetical protein